MQAQYVGTLVRITNEFSDSGELIDPTLVTLTLKVPNQATPVVYTYGIDAEVMRDEVGVFRFEYEPTVPGTFIYEWFGDGAVNVRQFDFFEVLAGEIQVMRIPDYMTSADLDARAGAATVDMLFDDDGDNQRDPPLVNQILCEAEDFAASMMLKSWNREAIGKLANNDVQFKGHVAWVALQLASERRAVWLSESGEGRYGAQYKRASDHFDRLSKSGLSSQGETTSGANRQSGGSLGPTNIPGKPTFVFAPDSRAPRGHGGF